MRVLITGHEGYIGAVMAPMFRDEGIDVVGLDSGLFADCDFGRQPSGIPGIRRDLREVEERDLEGFDAVIHLAAISNDPLGNLNPDCTYAINHRASVRLAELAKKVGVERFLYSSSCSVYGAASPDDVLDEQAAFSPVTPYAESKVRVEADLAPMASDSFCPVYLRNATVYGVSPRLRGDLVVNNLVGWAMTTGRVLLKSDGSPWRPLVHVEDVCRAFLAALRAPKASVHNQAFNVGRTGETFRIIEVAQMVADAIEASEVEIAEGAGPDPRCYRVNFEKIENSLPGYDPRWTVAKGVVQLREAYTTNGLSKEDLEGSRFLRIARIQELLDSKRLDEDLRFTDIEGSAK
ncbi:MAG: SDR family oxidoreductase [Proteobacteria bacterium]|nr:SDR family oxidoreductase [Pseudomonadota bacterium]